MDEQEQLTVLLHHNSKEFDIEVELSKKYKLKEFLKEVKLTEEFGSLEDIQERKIILNWQPKDIEVEVKKLSKAICFHYRHI